MTSATTTRQAALTVLLAWLLTLAIPLHPKAAVAAEGTGDRCPTLPGDQTWEQHCPEEKEVPGEGGGSDTVDYEGMGPVWDIALTTVDGEQCWMIRQVQNGIPWSEAIDTLNDWDSNDVALRACDFEGGPPTLYTLWIENICPPPTPVPVTLDPENSAITGKAGYLTIGGNRTPQVPCGGQTIDAEARYVIHWGNGSTTETTSQGGEWPDGDLTHVYEDKGNYTITVEAYWTGTVAGTTLPELPVPTSASVEVQVDEVQAVVTEQH